MTKKFLRSQNVTELLDMFEAEVTIQCNTRRASHYKASVKRALLIRAEIQSRAQAAGKLSAPGRGL